MKPRLISAGTLVLLVVVAIAVYWWKFTDPDTGPDGVAPESSPRSESVSAGDDETSVVDAIDDPSIALPAEQDKNSEIEDTRGRPLVTHSEMRPITQADIQREEERAAEQKRLGSDGAVIARPDPSDMAARYDIGGPGHDERFESLDEASSQNEGPAIGGQRPRVTDGPGAGIEDIDLNGLGPGDGDVDIPGPGPGENDDQTPRPGPGDEEQ